MPLYSFGSNGSGQLGVGHTEDISSSMRCLFKRYKPSGSNLASGTDDLSGSNQSPDTSANTDISEDSAIRRIVAGGNHTIVLFENGAVYAAGCNADGRCGQDRTDMRESILRFERVVIQDPETMASVDRFHDVAATWEGTFLYARLGDAGEEALFALGSGARGELGLGSREGGRKAITAARVHVPLQPGVNVLAIASGMGHSVVVLSNGEIYGWGGSRKGQLGKKAREQKIVWEPTKIEDLPFRATGAVCGREFTVIMGDRAAGELMVLGSVDNKSGILTDVPVAASSKGYTDIYASWHGVYVHRHDSSFIAWGRNDRGQLPPENTPRLKRLAIGSEHGIALFDDQTVGTFGWGEHGNCGPDTDREGNVRGRYNKISLPAGVSAVGVGAGCATSWIITS